MSHITIDRPADADEFGWDQFMEALCESETQRWMSHEDVMNLWGFWKMAIVPKNNK